MLRTLLFLILPTLIEAQDRPNILWLTAEDHGPHLGCYGDTYATTPTLDKLAKNSLRYTRASSNAPICAPARTTLITGIHAPTLGAQHMRSKVHISKDLRLFPQILSANGYYCTNNSKTDYNLILKNPVWDQSSNKAHYKNRPENKPFFAVFNITKSHESQIRNKNKNPHHDPSKAPVPPYHPDTPEVRKDWAQYYDRLTEVDHTVKKHLHDLEKANLAENTIVFYFADHGSGMPRHKRYVGWSGIHVPLIVHIPEKWKHLAPDSYKPGATSDRLVSFVDLAPTILSLASIQPLPEMQGAPIMGKFKSPAPKYSHGFVGRADERIDSSRSITDGQYLYIRNYYPFLSPGKTLHYQMQTPTTRIWHQLYQQKKLNPVQSAFWNPHPPEQLFDLKNDPHETINLANNPAHKTKLLELRQAHIEHLTKTRDTALLPEHQMHALTKNLKTTPSELTNQHYNPGKIITNQTNLQLLTPKQTDAKLEQSAKSKTPRTNNYWAYTHLLSRPPETIQNHLQNTRNFPTTNPLTQELIAKAHPQKSTRAQAIQTLTELANPEKNSLYTSIAALNSLSRLQPLSPEILKTLRAQKVVTSKEASFGKKYISRLRETLGISEKPKKQRRKNVLFIIADDLNCDLGCYGHPLVKSPNIDKLAAQSLRFNNTYSQNTRCNPSRTSFLTGLYPNITGVQTNNSKHFRKTIPDTITLPQLFKNNGYFTARVGKIYHYGVPSQIGTDGEDDPASWHKVINPRGIDREVHDQINTLQKGRFGGTLSWLKLDSKPYQHTDAIGADHAMQLIEENHPHKTQKPFFLAVGFYRPHTPYVAPSEFFDLHPIKKIKPYIMPKNDRDDIPLAALFDRPKQLNLTTPQRKEIIQAYYASIALMDQQVGRLLKHLKKCGLEDDTIIVFTSDHGYHLGAHGLWQKGDLFEGACRVPLLIKAPGVTTPGATTNSITEMLDYYPTLAELCDLDPPKYLQGKSLLPILKNPQTRIRTSALSMSPSTAHRLHKNAKKNVFGYSIRTPRYRYTEWNNGDQGTELYDYHTDPHELTNLAPHKPPLVKTLKKQLQTRINQATNIPLKLE